MPYTWTATLLQGQPLNLSVLNELRQAADTLDNTKVACGVHTMVCTSNFSSDRASEWGGNWAGQLTGVASDHNIWRK